MSAVVIWMATSSVDCRPEIKNLLKFGFRAARGVVKGLPLAAPAPAAARQIIVNSDLPVNFDDFDIEDEEPPQELPTMSQKVVPIKFPDESAPVAEAEVEVPPTEAPAAENTSEVPSSTEAPVTENESEISSPPSTEAAPEAVEEEIPAAESAAPESEAPAELSPEDPVTEAAEEPATEEPTS